MSEIRETWGRYAEAFVQEGAGAEDRESLRRLVELCALPTGSLVLDVASGAGYAGFAFARAGCRVIMSDPTHEMLLGGRAGWRERRLAGSPRSVEAWAESLPFADGSLDAVVAHRAPHQFADAAAWAAEARRTLKKGGVFALADQSPPDGWEQWHNELERWRDPTHERARSPSEWRAIAEGAGFTVRDTDVVYQTHDVEDWLDRVDCPADRREHALQMLRDIPNEIGGVYQPQTYNGRLHMRTPQCILVATS
ncbi:MAG TPA: methyltransferase domain-containing protein [Actinomycetota bacterium]|jgi:SAM-dependent methyltransferase|nr:methyltransferase domain-containing protein [Actinomycetota bacterium]